MKLITISRLQREFGLSYATAAGIIREQRKLASRRQWPLTALSLCVLLPGVAADFGGISLPHAVTGWMAPVVIALVVVQQSLIHRASRQPILDAAHHLRRKRNVCPVVTV
jgi:hypothetical protein